MTSKDKEFLKRLRSMFKIEAGEHLHEISSGLLELEKRPGAEKQKAIIEKIFRAAHNLKGASRTVNMPEIGEICQVVESLFSALKHQEIALSSSMFDALYKATDTIGGLVASHEQEGFIPARGAISDIVEQLQGLKAAELDQELEAGVPAPPEDDSAPPGEQHLTEGKLAPADTIRISRDKLDALFLQSEEMLSLKLMASQRVSDINELLEIVALWKKQRAKDYSKMRKSRHLPEGRRDVAGRPGAGTDNISEFIEWDQAQRTPLEHGLTSLARAAQNDRRVIDAMVDNLLEDMKKTLMLPFATLLEIFPRFVRELASEQNKQVELVTQGSDVEIDKRILEEMKDPLIHLIRNCIDHGIEKPQERERKNKPPRGKITISIARVNSSNIDILVSDDGAGVDLAKVKKSAVKRRIVSEEEVSRLTDQEVLSLIFQSEVSTSPVVTDLSGRGLGLAIVREKVEKLGGVISLPTNISTGLSLKIVLPLTLATFRGILVQVAEQVMTIPTSNVEQVLRIKQDEVRTLENRETIQLNGSAIPLVRLDNVLELPQKQSEAPKSSYIPVLILGASEKRIAFQVDNIVGEQEVLPKSLGKHLSRVRNVAGATILGSGQVVPILNVPDLLKSAIKLGAAPPIRAIPVEEVEAKRKSILVVEDSITSRMLLKNILESAGYVVKTAFDGVDAFTSLRTEEFDMVVSDVDMPRMDGFVLTSKIRSDKKLAEMPVVLVTALDSKEDRERGIDVGADAYIVKSSFDQSNLLEIVKRLIR